MNASSVLFPAPRWTGRPRSRRVALFFAPALVLSCVSLFLSRPSQAGSIDEIEAALRLRWHHREGTRQQRIFFENVRRQGQTITGTYAYDRERTRRGEAEEEVNWGDFVVRGNTAEFKDARGSCRRPFEGTFGIEVREGRLTLLSAGRAVGFRVGSVPNLARQRDPVCFHGELDGDRRDGDKGAERVGSGGATSIESPQAHASTKSAPVRRGAPAEGLLGNQWRAPCLGLYVGGDGRQLVLWPGGRFTWDTAVLSSDGRLDYARTVAALKPHRRGVFRETGPLDDGVGVLFTYADGRTETVVRRIQAGSCGFRDLDVFQARKPDFRELSGEFSSGFSETVSGAGNSEDGRVGTDLTVGGSTSYTFLPGRRFVLKGNSFVGTYTTMGTGTASHGIDASHGKTKDRAAGGTYSIEGNVLRFQFDDGRLMLTLFGYSRPIPAKDGGWLTDFTLKFGGRVYRCGEGCQAR